MSETVQSSYKTAIIASAILFCIFINNSPPKKKRKKRECKLTFAIHLINCGGWYAWCLAGVILLR